METPFASFDRDLRKLLYDKAALYYGADDAREALVASTLRAAAAGIDLNPDLSVDDALFEIMRDIAQPTDPSPVTRAARIHRNSVHAVWRPASWKGSVAVTHL